VTGTRRLFLVALTRADGTDPGDGELAERWGYCGQCGKTWPRQYSREVVGTQEQVHAWLLPFFLDHTCDYEE
jgi:hypothetical protein